MSKTLHDLKEELRDIAIKLILSYNKLPSEEVAALVKRAEELEKEIVAKNQKRI